MWLLADNVLREMQRAERQGLALGHEAQQRAFEARALSNGTSSILTVAGSTAEITVEGILTKRPDFWAALFGGANTAYSDIITALAEAQNDPRVKNAVLRVDSPGGHVDGLFDTIASIQAFKKPMRVRAENAQSAAFAIAAAGGKIEATGPASNFGSIGTAVDFVLWSDEEIISLTNSDSPDKRPDPKTEEGRAVIVKYLDAVNDLFVDAIATGRGVSKGVVTQDYGRGATLLAGEAKRRGMIDSIRKQFEPRVVGAAAAQPREVAAMDRKTLRAEYPDLCDELVAQGAQTERDRVFAHVTLGERSGAMDVAVKAIKSGEGMTLTLQAEYMSAGMNRRDVRNRQEESDAAGAALVGATLVGADRAQDVGDAAVALMAARRGKKLVPHG